MAIEPRHIGRGWRHLLVTVFLAAAPSVSAQGPPSPAASVARIARGQQLTVVVADPPIAAPKKVEIALEPIGAHSVQSE
jgi:hypothetical protein